MAEALPNVCVCKLGTWFSEGGCTEVGATYAGGIAANLLLRHGAADDSSKQGDSRPMHFGRCWGVVLGSFAKYGTVAKRKLSQLCVLRNGGWSVVASC